MDTSQEDLYAFLRTCQ